VGLDCRPDIGEEDSGVDFGSCMRGKSGAQGGEERV